MLSESDIITKYLQELGKALVDYRRDIDILKDYIKEHKRNYRQQLYIHNIEDYYISRH